MQDSFNPAVPRPIAEKLGQALLKELDRNNPALIDTPIALSLIRSGADVTLQNQWQRTALHHAANSGNLEIATALIDAGAPLDGKNNHGHTPLCVAVLYGRTDIVRLLLKAGAIPDAENNCGQTPLARARELNRTEIATMLEEAMDDWRHQGLPLKSDVKVSKPLKLRLWR
ncbi:MAG: ankyrin repeat domain-containing protein [Alphaproteobacteria bacterium]